jgi:hypothetical protein
MDGVFVIGPIINRDTERNISAWGIWVDKSSWATAMSGLNHRGSR